MSSRILIGIHGLSRKPEEAPHTLDWKRAICEGLVRNAAANIKPDRLDFELVYWADWLGLAPLKPEEDTEPYSEVGGSGPFPSHQLRFTDTATRIALDTLAEPIDLAKGAPSLDSIRRLVGLDDLGAALLQKRLVDLGTYYREKDKRDLLRKRLADKLTKHKDKRIMLVAHSMGSIVAYDVLRDLGRVEPDLVVEHFVTLGSPLGMPYVLKNIRTENPSARTPSMVRRWSNLADRRDPVAIDVHLRDEFEPNDRGVAVEDALVVNGYLAPPNPPGKANHHKIYGYLRAPEFTQLVKTFI